MKKIIYGIVIGVCLVVTVGVVYEFIQVSNVVSQDHATLTQVVGFLNQEIAASQKQTTPVK
jgi:hypothetical protein